MTHAHRPLAAALLATAALAGAPGHAADAVHPLVIELFQSQGCSSCPPANANVSALAGKPGILALSFAVTYWDQLGWKDTFARQAYTDRQWTYAHALRHDTVFTPQVVVNGRKDGVGIDPAGLRALLVAADRGKGGPTITLKPRLVAVSASVSTPGLADVWLVRYDPRVVEVPIKRGENGGKTLPHKNIVKEITRLGAWRGGAISLPIAPPSDPNLKTAILVQRPAGGPILAATTS